MRALTVLLAAALPATLFFDWFEVAGTRFSGWESFHRIDLVLVGLCLGLVACEAIPRWRRLGRVRVLLSGVVAAVVAHELISPPAGETAIVAVGGKAAAVLACALLASTLFATAQRSGARRRADGWALLLLPSALLAVLGWAHRWTADDAFINFRVADQLLAGNGPVFNAGERIEVYTSTLWLAVLTALHAVLSFVAFEWIAVLLGLALAVAGLAAATVAARLLHGNGAAIALPVGALAFVALPPAWDYATSGLETGLWFTWLGGVFLALVAAERSGTWAHRRRRRPSRLDLLAVAIGLGPLVRPDFAIFSASFFVALLVVQRPTSVRSALRPVLLAVALPAAYQVFRMGYFAMLVPNTALAKEAGLTRWDQGAAYAWDTLGTYWLVVPLALLGAWLARRLPHLSRTKVLLASLPVLAGALHIAYVIKVGGDFMHGRLLLPGLFALLMPVAALPLSPDRAVAGAVAAAVAIWAVVAATELRTSYAGTSNFSNRGLADEWAYYRAKAGHDNPVTLEDYEQDGWAALGAEARQPGERNEPIVLDEGETFGELPSQPGLLQPTVVLTRNIGLLGYAAGPEVHVVDRRGLGDPVASRLRLDQRGRPGHEKLLDYPWAIARFSSSTPGPADVDPDCSDCLQRLPEVNEQVPPAREALKCGTLHDVILAVTEPMSLSRFFENLALAPRATTVRFAAEPVVAERELCD